MLSGDTSELIKATEIDKYVLERGNSETVFFVLHQTYALEQSLYARDVIKWLRRGSIMVSRHDQTFAKLN
jgi:hypothetical protein